MQKPDTSPVEPRLSGRDVQRTSIAIIGIGCRFPGAHGSQRFWQLLLNAVDAVDDHDDSFRRLLSAHPDQDGPVRGGLLDNIDEFDAEFFGMSPREAQRTDPQARLLLETAWEALEDAGLNPDHLAGSRTGVFVGQAVSNYWDLVRRGGQPDIHAVVGSEVRGTLPGRISFTFDLRGPSVSVDTGCSASLTAVHQACQSIRAGESEAAIAAGVNLALLSDEAIAYSRAKLLAADGRCKFGDASADGFVRSDGMGVVVLKPLDGAIADGDRVYAVIRGSAINNDGRSGGRLMTPGLASQKDLLRQAYQDAGVAPGDVAYVEAHGTGTSTGDPIELSALGSVLGEGRAAGNRCLVGSVKTNIGHAEAAAGIAGLIKAALCLQHRTIPPSLHFHEPNPAVAWESMPVVVPTERTELPRCGRPAIAGVSSFGISGANAHVVLAEHIRQDQPATPFRPPSGHLQLLVLSARSREALRDLARCYADFLGPGGAGREFDLRDICRTAATRRKHLTSRLAVTGGSHEEMERKLRGFLAGRAVDGAVSRDPVPGPPRIAFAFPGQGSQWLGMGRDLLGTSEAFRAAMVCCDEAVHAETGVSVLQQLEGDGSRLADVDVLQPALWAIEVALATLLRSIGLEPDLVVGHSMGEVAAAHVAGVLSLRDAAAVICRRSRLARQLSGGGAMAAVALSGEEATEVIADCRGMVTVAACNSPSSTVLSGEPQSLHKVLAGLDRRSVFHRLLNVDFASHSPQVDAVGGGLRDALLDIRPRSAGIPFYSTVTDEIVDGSAFGAAYWVENLRQPVRFSSAVNHIAELAPTLFLEISPHPILVEAIRDVLSHYDLAGAAVESLRRQQPAWPCLLESLGTIHTLGGPVGWQELTGAGPCVQLPSYAWQRKRHWIDGPVSTPARPEPAAGNGAGPPRAEGAEASQPYLVPRPFEMTGDLRLIDPADQTLVELPGARLQFVAKGLAGPSSSRRPTAITAPGPSSGPAHASLAGPGTEPSAQKGDLGGSIVGEVASVLASPTGDVDTGRSLPELGLDSLMASELALRLRTHLGLTVTAGALLTGRPLAELVDAMCLGTTDGAESKARHRRLSG